MENTGSTSKRNKVALIAGFAALAIVAALALYVAGVGGGTEFNGVRFVTLEDGTVRLRVHGVGVGTTREEVDASPLAAGQFGPGGSTVLYRLAGEPGTTLGVLTLFDEEGRVKHLHVEYEGGRLTLMRVASRYRALFASVGGTCDGKGCAVTADLERTTLGAALHRRPGGLFGLSVIR
jgi:hypothetical protein